MKKIVYSIATLLAASLLALHPGQALAQVSIGAPTPDASAVLDLVSGNKGMLAPRVSLASTTDAATVPSPAATLLVFNTNAALPGGAGFYYNAGTPAAPNWLRLVSSSAPAGQAYWGLTGNAGTSPGTNFLGTTDAQPLVFRASNVERLRLRLDGGLDVPGTNQNLFIGTGTGVANTTGANNLFAGIQAGNGNTTGNANVFSGYQSGFANTLGGNNTFTGSQSGRFNTTGFHNTFTGTLSGYANTTASNNTFNGFRSGYSTTSGSNNTFSGYQSGFANTTGVYNSFYGAVSGASTTSGSYNVFAGYESGSGNTTGSYNTFSGTQSGYANTTGYANVFTGYQSGQANTTGYNNVFNGSQSGYYNTTGLNNVFTGVLSGRGNTTGTNNAFYGHQSGYTNTEGVNNAFVGTQSGFSTTSGSNNLFSGYRSGYANTTGSNNTLIGYAADVAAGNLTNATAIGYNAIAGASSSLVLGGTGVDAVKVGIGVTAPVSTLHVKGTAKFFSAADAHTGNFWSGTANQNGIELAAAAAEGYIAVQRSSGAGLHVSKPAAAADGSLVHFYVAGSLAGSITTSGSSTAYNTTSDARLKENVRNTSYGLSTLMKVQVKDYNYISDKTKALSTGVLAQELYKLYPQAVTKGGADAATNPWTVDYSKLTPVLIKSVQELQAQVEALKAENLALRGTGAKADAAVQRAQQAEAAVLTLEQRLAALENMLGTKAQATK